MPEYQSNAKEKKSSEATRSNLDLSGKQQLVISPQCVARLACHVHRDYLEELENTKANLPPRENQTDSGENSFRELENWFDSL